MVSHSSSSSSRFFSSSSLLNSPPFSNSGATVSHLAFHDAPLVELVSRKRLLSLSASMLCWIAPTNDQPGGGEGRPLNGGSSDGESSDGGSSGGGLFDGGSFGGVVIFEVAGGSSLRLSWGIDSGDRARCLEAVDLISNNC